MGLSNIRGLQVGAWLLLALFFSGFSTGCDGDNGPRLRDTTLVPGTLDGFGPFTVTTIVDGGAPIDSLVLQYSLDAENWESVKMRELASQRFIALINPLDRDQEFFFTGDPWPPGTEDKSECCS